MTKIFMAYLFFLSSIISCGGGGGGTEESDDDTTPDVAAARSTSTDGFGGLMVNKEGESLMPMVDNEAAPTKVTGALWTDAAGGNVAVYLDDDGMPEKTVIGDFILLFSNWSADGTTADIAKIYVPTDYIEIFKSVAVASNFSVPRNMSTRATCFPACETDLENTAQLFKIAGLSVTLGLCGVGIAVTGGIASLPCAGVIVTTATLIVGDETWLHNLEKTSLILTAVDAFKCTLGDAEGCVTAGLEVGSRVLEQVNKVVEEGAEAETDAEVFLEDTAQESGVAQGTSDDLPSCSSGSYECSPNAYMPCYPDGVKQCAADCTWGSCDATDECGDGICDSSIAGENNTNCSSDCAAATCGDGVCASSETSTNCNADCGAVNECCATTNNCPSETPYECNGDCCCCPEGSVCTTDSVCS